MHYSNRRISYGAGNEPRVKSVGAAGTPPPLLPEQLPLKTNARLQTNSIFGALDDPFLQSRAAQAAQAALAEMDVKNVNMGTSMFS